MCDLTDVYNTSTLSHVPLYDTSVFGKLYCHPSHFMDSMSVQANRVSLEAFADGRKCSPLPVHLGSGGGDGRCFVVVGDLIMLKAGWARQILETDGGQEQHFFKCGGARSSLSTRAQRSVWSRPVSGAAAPRLCAVRSTPVCCAAR